MDGELFAPSLTFEELSGLVRTQTVDGKDLLEYHVFDCFTIDERKGVPSEQGFWDRFSVLKERLEASEGDVIKLVPTERRPKADVHEILDHYVREGHEGVMIRNLVAPYVLAKRTFWLQKLKPFRTEAFEIVGAESGAGKDRGCVTWHCRTSSGTPFKVRPKGTVAQRREWLEKESEYRGKHLLVKYQESTASGVPRFPVGVGFADGASGGGVGLRGSEVAEEHA